jgi:WD40 repeat protein
VAEQLLSQRRAVGPLSFSARVLWKRSDSKAPAAPRPGWLQWLPLPAAADGGHTRPVNAVAFALQESALLTGGDDGQAFLWAADSGRRLATLAPHEGKIAGVAAVGPGLVATAAWDQCIRVFSRWGVLKKVIRLEGSSRIYALAASGDGARIAAGLGSKQIRVWDTATGAETACLRGHTRKVLAVAFHPGGERLVSGSSDMSVRLWDVKRGPCHLTLYGHSDEVTAVAVSPDGRWIASGGRDGVIFLWDARTGQPQLKIPAKVSAVTALAFAPDAAFLLAGGSDPIVRCWDLARGQEAGRLEGGHSRAVRALALAADGRRIASCGADGRVIAWERH